MISDRDKSDFIENLAESKKQVNPKQVVTRMTSLQQSPVRKKHVIGSESQHSRIISNFN